MSSTSNTAIRKHKYQYHLREAQLKKNDKLVKEYEALLALSGEEFDKAADLKDTAMAENDVEEVEIFIKPLLQNDKTVGYTDKQGNMYTVGKRGKIFNASGEIVGSTDKKGRLALLGQNGQDIYDIYGKLVAALGPDGVARDANGLEVPIPEMSEDSVSEDEGRKKRKGKKKKKTVRIKREQSPSSVSDTEESFEESDSEKSDSGKTDSEYGKALYTRGNSLGKDVTSVAYCGSNSGIKYINRYGPKRFGIYRLQKIAHSAAYEEKAESGATDAIDVSNPENRYGDKKIPGTRKNKYKSRHIKHIFAVAWEGDGSAGDLNLIDPAMTAKWPTTYVLIEWDIDGDIVKTWETRQAVRARWGKKIADEAIFEAASEGQKQYERRIGGPRSKSYSRSPSTGLIVRTVERERQKSLDRDRPRYQSTVAKTRATRRRQSPPSDTDTDMTEAFEKFKITYCRMSGVDDFSELSRAEKTECVLGWQEEENRLRGLV